MDCRIGAGQELLKIAHTVAIEIVLGPRMIARLPRGMSKVLQHPPIRDAVSITIDHGGESILDTIQIVWDPTTPYRFLLFWWRMAIGSVTGFVLYWAIMFLSFSALPKTLALNPASAVVCALLGGWLGLSVFSLVLKTLRITGGPDGASPPQRRPLVQARS